MPTKYIDCESSKLKSFSGIPFSSPRTSTFGIKCGVDQVTLQEYSRTQIGRRPQLFGKGRRPQFSGKWKTTSIFWKIEDDLNFLENGRQPQFSGK